MENKVLVITTTFPRFRNDTTARFVYDLSEKLASKYKIIVLAPHHKGAEKKERLGNMGVMRFAYFKPESLQKLCYNGGVIPNIKKSLLAKIQMPFLLMSEFFYSYRIIRKEKVEMIHAHWMLPQGFVGAAFKKFFKIPLLVTVHGSDLFPLKSRLFKKLQYSVVKNADYVTVNSRATLEELLKRFPEFSSKVKIIPMGVDTSLFRKRKLQKPRKYTKNKLLLFVGRLSDQKGLQYLINSMKEISKHFRDAKLLVIGSGPYEKALRQLAHDNEMESSVEFLGPMSIKHVAEYYNFADVFILPSVSSETGTEALGLALLEAMSSGCAVIGTNTGGIPFIIKNGYNGLLVKEKNSEEISKAITKLLKDKKMAGKLGANAAKFVENNYSWEKISKDFIQIYDKLLKSEST